MLDRKRKIPGTHIIRKYLIEMTKTKQFLAIVLCFFDAGTVTAGELFYPTTLS